MPMKRSRRRAKKPVKPIPNACCVRISLTAARDKRFSPAQLTRAEKILTGPGKVDKRDLTSRLMPDGQVMELVVCRSAQTTASNLFDPGRLRKKKVTPLNDMPALFRRRIRTARAVEADWLCDCL